MWLDDPFLVKKIETFEIDYRSFMSSEENKKRMHVSDTCNLFEKPAHIEQRLKEISIAVKSYNERHAKDKEYFL